MGRVFRPAVRRAKLDGMNFHDLRHGYVSLMAQAGVHPTVIARLVGHADGGALLMRRYRHLFPDETRLAVAAFDRLVRGGVAQGSQAPPGDPLIPSRDGQIRTDDPLLPKQVRYQAAPRPVATKRTRVAALTPVRRKPHGGLVGAPMRARRGGAIMMCDTQG